MIRTEKFKVYLVNDIFRLEFEMRRLTIEVNCIRSRGNAEVGSCRQTFRIDVSHLPYYEHNIAARVGIAYGLFSSYKHLAHLP